MFRTWLLLSLRHMARNRAHTIVNILGLSLGLATCLVIALSLLHDLRYDRFLPDSDRIVRMYNSWQDDKGVVRNVHAPCSGMLAAMLPSVFPEVEATVRMQQWGPRQIQRADLPLGTPSGVLVPTVYADSSFLTVFGYHVVEGDPRTALDSPSKVLITASTARSLFGQESAVGKPVIAGDINNAVVGGVVADPPSTSHMQFGMVLPIFRNPENEYWFESWTNLWVLVYAKLTPGADRAALEQKILAYYRDQQEISSGHRLHLMPLHDIHLHSGNQGYNWINSRGRDPASLLILASLGLVVFLIAVVNYINLTTAQAVNRAREVGIRKSLGGSRGTLILGYLVESVLLTLVSGVIAVGIALAALPELPQMLGHDLSKELLATPLVPVALLAALLITGLLAGIYPAIVLSSYQPVTVLKTGFSSSRAGVVLRRLLVVGQFTLSIALVVAVLVINQQLTHVLTQDLGYDRDQVIIFEADGTDHPEDARDLLLERLNSDSRLVAAGAANNLPGSNLPFNPVHPTGSPDPDSSIGMVVFDVRGHWFDALGIKVLQGRPLRTDRPTDEQNAVVINQAAADRLGLTDAVGQPFTFGSDADLHRSTIVGVVDNFHYGTARDRTRPAFFHPGRVYSSRIFVRLRAGQIQQGIDAVKEAYRDVFNQRLIGIRFLDDQFRDLYEGDRAFARSVTLFSALALVIACLGILGLTSYSVKQRQREIAVRKVLGASEGSLVRLLAGNFLRWVLLANLLAWPLAWWGLSTWLKSFVLRIPLTPVPFLLAGLLAFLLAAATIAGQSIGAARRNPTDSLRAE